jgi:multiple sugar transport system permease protein
MTSYFPLRAITARRGRFSGGSSLERVLPYLLLAPTLLLILAVVVYPIGYGIRQSFLHFRFGHVVGSVGFDNYRQLFSDPAFGDALWVTIKFVLIAVTIETVLGLALALLVAAELPFTRAAKLILIVPMIVTPIVVGIVFRLIYASDVGLLTTLSRDLFGAGPVFVLDKGWSAFTGLVGLDVWEWTPLMFLILLAGLQSLPLEPFEAARVDGAGGWRTFRDHTLPMLRPVLAVAIALRTIDAFTTFDQVFVLTKGGPGTSTQLISIYGYNTAFKFDEFGYGVAMLLTVALVVLAFAALTVRLIRRQAVTQ